MPVSVLGLHGSKPQPSSLSSQSNPDPIWLAKAVLTLFSSSSNRRPYPLPTPMRPPLSTYCLRRSLWLYDVGRADPIASLKPAPRLAPPWPTPLPPMTLAVVSVYSLLATLSPATLSAPRSRPLAPGRPPTPAPGKPGH